MGFVPRPIAWAVVLAMLSADCALLAVYWPTLSQPLSAAGMLSFGDESPATRPTTAVLPRLPGTVRRSVGGVWSVLSPTLAMNAQPTNSSGFIFHYSYISASPGDLVDWRTMIKLRGQLARYTAYFRGPMPDGFTRDQVIRLKPLLLPLPPPLDAKLKQKMEAELTALANKAANKSPMDLAFFADEKQLLEDLAVAAKAAEPALHDRLAQCRAVVGDRLWAQLSPLKKLPATRSLASPATRPSTPARASFAPLSMNSGTAPG